MNIVFIILNVFLWLTNLAYIIFLLLTMHRRKLYKKYYPAEPMTYKDYKSLKSVEKDTGIKLVLQKPYCDKEQKLKDKSIVYALMCAPKATSL